MEPMTILGAVFGGFVTKLLPGWLTDCLLFLLLVVMAERLWRKAASTYAAESALSRAASDASRLMDEEAPSPVRCSSTHPRCAARMLGSNMLACVALFCKHPGYAQACQNRARLVLCVHISPRVAAT
jgi:putative Ca2+/H+ antiporter (TMEM165/GDT1 family)